MQTPQPSANAARLRAALIVGVVFCAALVVAGLLLHPTVLSASPTALQALIAALGILIIYGLLSYFWLAVLARADPRILLWATRTGLVCGLIFIAEMILEYVLLPSDNSVFGLVEFGSVLFLYFAVSIVVANQTNKIRSGLTASM